MSRVLAKLRERAVDAKPDELRALGLAFVFHFIVLASYYVLRPIRDDIGAAGGLENLSWMYTGTMVTMLVANGLFSALVARYSRRRFIPIVYRFFIANLVVFYFLMKFAPPAQQVWVGRSFFVWVSVFNLFVATVFWAFMTDIFNTEQAKRLFGFIAVGGTSGAIVGGTATALLVKKIGPLNLLFVSAILLELAAQCVRFLPTHFSSADRTSVQNEPGAEKPIGGNLWSGVTHVVRSPYLLGICGFVMLYGITSTLAYFQQADIAGHQFHDRASRTAFFAQVDISVNVLTILVQIFLTSRLLKWLGVGITLALLPAVNVVGFFAMGWMPLLSLLVLFQTLRRASNFAVSRPAREVLFTVLRREDKYKAKSFIDTFVYRLGDQVGAWSYPLLTWLGLGLTGISFVAAPLAAGWCVLSLWLGRKQVALARERDASGLG
ncbi:MAG: MFS transporter [Verrucomicrobiota bacterium]|nr:MFS transporter [Verrucomicrobiota bacterium]